MNNSKNILLMFALIKVLGVDPTNIYANKPCPAPEKPLAIPSINPQSPDPVDQAIINYAPIIYLSKKEKTVAEKAINRVKVWKGYDSWNREPYFPMTFEYYLAQPAIRVLYGHKKREIVLDKGQVTMEALASIDYKKYTNPERNLFIENSKCTDHGDNPETVYITPEGTKFTSWEKDKNNNQIIRTPYYAIFTSQGGHDYIQYIFVYGYNGDYSIIPGLPGVGSHKMDVEHLMLQFEDGSIKKGNPKLIRISFPAHGSGEAKWLDANNPDLKFEDTHVVAYSAYHGHGLYPEIGSYIRICGFGTDVTDAGQKWFPRAIIRVEEPSHPEFNKEKIGIFAFKGDLGPTGVSGMPGKKWFGFPNKEDGGVNYKTNFCPKGKSCNILKDTFKSCKAPESLQTLYEGTNIFTRKTLPTKEAKVKQGTVFYIFKNSEIKIKTERSGAKAEKEQKINDFIRSLTIDGAAEVIEDDEKFTITFTKPGKVHLKFSNEIKPEIIKSNDSNNASTTNNYDYQDNKNNLPVAEQSTSVTPIKIQQIETTISVI